MQRERLPKRLDQTADMKNISTCFCLIAAGMQMAAPVVDAATNNKTATRLADAALVLKEVMSIKERAIPQDLLNKAKCVIVVPGMKQGAFLFGGRYGRGFLSCRNENGIGWTARGRSASRAPRSDFRQAAKRAT
jgi:lipid-binding SYLF domain-containing protein